MQKTDYSKIVNTYNKRYSLNYLVNIEKEIKNIIDNSSDIKKNEFFLKIRNLKTKNYNQCKAI